VLTVSRALLCRHPSARQRFVRATSLLVTGAVLSGVVSACGGSNQQLKTYTNLAPSMLPTVKPGARVQVDLRAYRSSSPRLGDILLFHPPHGADSLYSPVCGDPNQGANHSQACDKPSATESSQIFIKRVVGLPGDRIQILKGHVIRNGKPEKDSYINPCGSADSCDFPQPITIPPGDYFMLGDNRGVSDDSRFWGPVPAAWVLGKVIPG
jgi:signal peptidase I